MDNAVIVGAGVFGASLAWWLAREGVAVTLVDRLEPGDPRATSGGESRLIRLGPPRADAVARARVRMRRRADGRVRTRVDGPRRGRLRGDQRRDDGRAGHPLRAARPGRGRPAVPQLRPRRP